MSDEQIQRVLAKLKELKGDLYALRGQVNRSDMAEWRLFVDDERVGPQGQWTFAPTYEKAIYFIENFGMPVDMSLDHDMWTSVLQGLGFVEWLEMYIDQGHPLPLDFKYSIHSSNAGGREAMHEVMKRITGKEAAHLRVWWN